MTKHLITVHHKPKTRANLPGAWETLQNDKVCFITESGPYWFKSLQKKTCVLSIKMQDLDTEQVSFWEK